jgi:hypothetical protein
MNENFSNLCSTTTFIKLKKTCFFIVQLKVNEKFLRLIFINEYKVKRVLVLAISCIEAVFENLIFQYYNF